MQAYLERYRTVAETGIDTFVAQECTPAFLDYLYKVHLITTKQHYKVLLTT